jgi:hypothetical protein
VLTDGVDRRCRTFKVSLSIELPSRSQILQLLRSPKVLASHHQSFKLAYYVNPTFSYYPTAVMSPTAFRHKVTDLVAHLLRCREYCDAVVANRHISREHSNLDNLRAALKTCSNGVWFEFNALRNVLGSRMDLGDESARYWLSYNIRDLEWHVELRLRDIALRRNDGPAGFKDILRKVERIEEKVKTIMIDLGRRLGTPTLAFAPAPVVTSSILLPRSPRRRETKSKRVSFTAVDTLRHHLKDSWEEELVGNRVLYVNCYDRTKTQWERPNGFIKPLSRSVGVPVWAPSGSTMALARRDPLIEYRIL